MEKIKPKGAIINGKHRTYSSFLGDITGTNLPIPSSETDPIYRRWLGMMSRCHGKGRCASYRIYARYGIAVCEEWHGIEGFYRFKTWALENGFSEDLVIDRIDTYKDYSPDNCRWITQKENVRNRRNIKTVMFHGEETRICELAERFNFPYMVVYSRLKNGWDVERAVFERVNGKDAEES